MNVKTNVKIKAFKKDVTLGFVEYIFIFLILLAALPIISLLILPFFAICALFASCVDTSTDDYGEGDMSCCAIVTIEK